MLSQEVKCKFQLLHMDHLLVFS